MQLILGSQSPRRSEIMSYYSYPFKQVVSQFDESSIEFKGNPVAYVTEISKGKAQMLHLHNPDSAILTADTAVYRHGIIYGKPKSEEEAIETLFQLSGQWHSVFSGVTLKYGDQEYSKVEETRVLFNPLTRREIETYHRQLNLYDKAGSYQLQLAGGLIVNKIDGCYYNVLGLPINSVRSLLKEIGIDLWDYLK